VTQQNYNCRTSALTCGASPRSEMALMTIAPPTRASSWGSEVKQRASGQRSTMRKAVMSRPRAKPRPTPTWAAMWAARALLEPNSTPIRTLRERGRCSTNRSELDWESEKGRKIIRGLRFGLRIYNGGAELGLNFAREGHGLDLEVFRLTVSLVFPCLPKQVIAITLLFADLTLSSMSSCALHLLWAQS
jgi:hypothetical protein